MSLRSLGTTNWVATGGGALWAGPMSEKKEASYLNAELIIVEQFEILKAFLLKMCPQNGLMMPCWGTLFTDPHYHR